MKARAYHGNRMEPGAYACDGNVLVVVEAIRTKAARERLTRFAPLSTGTPPRPQPTIAEYVAQQLARADLMVCSHPHRTLQSTSRDSAAIEVGVHQISGHPQPIYLRVDQLDLLKQAVRWDTIMAAGPRHPAVLLVTERDGSRRPVALLAGMDPTAMENVKP